MANGTPAARIPRSNLGDGVYRHLWQRILDRRLRPGEKLSDLRLSEELGVSRTPVREALQRLVQEGVVTALPNRGFRVSIFSARDVAEIYDLRAALETMALRIAAPRFDHAALEASLNDLNAIERRYAAAGTDVEELDAASSFLDLDRGFHRSIVELADNSRLTAIVEGLWGQIAVFQRAGTFSHHWTELAITRHREIIAALLADDLDAALETLRGHILEVRDLVITDLTGDPSPRPRIDGAAR